MIAAAILGAACGVVLGVVLDVIAGLYRSHRCPAPPPHHDVPGHLRRVPPPPFDWERDS